jgi:hypothetical protein
VTRGLKSTTTDEAAADKKQSTHVQRILEERKKDAKVDPLLEQQFKAGRLLAAITSRPGQSGRADGYILEGKELDVSYWLDPGMLANTDPPVLPQEAPSQEGQARRLGWIDACTMNGSFMMQISDSAVMWWIAEERTRLAAHVPE